MDIITLARQLGKAIQEDERYLQLQVARQNSDEDQELQNAIGEFNLKRMAINNEATKENRDDEKLKKFNEELRQVYTQIMQNPNMIAYNHAKESMDAVLKRVNAIVSLCADGADPDTADLTEESCGGSCASCAGCH